MAKRSKPAGKFFKPNYFVAVEITNTEVISKVMQAWNEITQQPYKFPQCDWLDDMSIFHDCMVPASKLHFTLNVMHINGEPYLKTAQNVLEEVGHLVYEEMQNNPIDISIQGLGQLGNNVIIAQVKDKCSVDRLTELNNLLQNKFHERLNLPIDTRPYVPHLTVAKIVTFSTCHQMGIKSFPLDTWKHFEQTQFGVQRVTILKLLKMGTNDPSTGKYKCHGSYEFF